METETPTTESESDRAPSLLWRFLLAACVAVLLYVLSMGPVAKFAVDGKIPLSILFVYDPLGYAADRLPVLDHIIVWYMNRWGVPVQPAAARRK